MNDAPPLTTPEPSAWKAWLNLVRSSWQRQARAHLMVWIAASLLLFLAVWVGLLSSSGAWDVRTWRRPFRGGLTYKEWAVYARFAPRELLAQKQQADMFKPSQRPSERWANLYQQNQATRSLPLEQRAPPPPMALTADLVQIAIASAYAVALENEDVRLGIAFVRFSRVIVFNIFATFLLPLCSLSFATEALGREREQRNLMWTLTRPIPRWQAYLGKFVALLPWCLTLNIGGFAVICCVAGGPGLLAFNAYWPAVFLGTFAFAALFHLMGAVFRRPAVLAILYSFFLETVMGNLPGHLKRASISFYMRSMMYEQASHYQLQPDRPLLYNAVSGPIAVAVLVGLSALLLALGAWAFSRMEYLEPT